MIEVGAIIKLRPSAFEQEFETFHWKDKYLYEDRFEAITLRFKSLSYRDDENNGLSLSNSWQRGDQASTLFGSSEAIITDIEFDPDEQPFMIWTDNFCILYAAALKNSEFIVLPAENHNLRMSKAEQQMIEDLEFFEQQYLNGLFCVLERENNKRASYKAGLAGMIRDGKWKK